VRDDACTRTKFIILTMVRGDLRGTKGPDTIKPRFLSHCLPCKYRVKSADSSKLGERSDETCHPPALAPSASAAAADEGDSGVLDGSTTSPSAQMPKRRANNRNRGTSGASHTCFAKVHRQMSTREYVQLQTLLKVSSSKTHFKSTKKRETNSKRNACSLVQCVQVQY
jgi:hypothetical protein